MNFDPKRKSRVGFKMLRQREEDRDAKKRVWKDSYEELDHNEDHHKDNDKDDEISDEDNITIDQNSPAMERISHRWAEKYFE
jgi:hypothetical protein